MNEIIRALLTFVIQGIIEFITSKYAISNLNELYKAGRHLRHLSNVFSIESSATLMVNLLELSPGICRALKGFSRKSDRTSRYAAYILAFVVVALAVAQYGLDLT